MMKRKEDKKKPGYGSYIVNGDMLLTRTFK